MGPQNSGSSNLPADPKRVRAFANFFKRYMSLSSLVTAALPIPITAFKLIPTFSVHTKVLSVYTSLFCFLILAFIFFSRHKLARSMFSSYYRESSKRIIRINALPAVLIFFSLACLLGYHYFLEGIIPSYLKLEARQPYLQSATPTPFQSITLLGLYLGVFIFAEAAFILMAIKEYLQDVLGLSDLQIISKKISKLKKEN